MMKSFLTLLRFFLQFIISLSSCTPHGVNASRSCGRGRIGLTFHFFRTRQCHLKLQLLSQCARRIWNIFGGKRVRRAVLRCLMMHHNIMAWHAGECRGIPLICYIIRRVARRMQTKSTNDEERNPEIEDVVGSPQLNSAPRRTRMMFLFALVQQRNVPRTELTVPFIHAGTTALHRFVWNEWTHIVWKSI